LSKLKQFVEHLGIAFLWMLFYVVVRGNFRPASKSTRYVEAALHG
jgi:hypothetical protein